MFQPGDIAACYGADFLSRVIRYGTVSSQRPCLGPSHVALLSVLPEQESLPVRWWESTTRCSLPCLLQQRPVSGVQVHRQSDRIAEIVAGGGKVEIYRLTALHQLSGVEACELSKLLVPFLGTTYDTAGALLAGTRVFKACGLFPGADLHSLFCSELIAAVLMRMGRMNLDNPTRFSPASLMRELIATGVYALQETF